MEILTDNVFISLMFHTLWIVLLTIAFSIALNFRNITKAVRETDKASIIIILILMSINLAVSSSYVNVIFTQGDEVSYSYKAEQMAMYGARGVELIQKPLAYSFVIHILFFALGPGFDVVYHMNAIFGALLIPAFYCLTHIITRDRKASIYSASIISLLPLSLALSNTMEMYTMSSLLLVITVSAVLYWRETGTFQSGMLAVSFLAFTLYSRLEFIIIIPLLLLIGVKRDYFRNNLHRMFLLGFLLTLLILPQMVFVNTPSYHEHHGVMGGIFLAERIYWNASWNLSNPNQAFGLLLVFAIPGFIWLLFKDRVLLLFSILWVLSFSLMYFSFWSYLTRFFLFIYAILIPMTSVSLMIAVNAMEKIMPKSKTIRALLHYLPVALILVLLAGWYSTLAGTMFVKDLLYYPPHYTIERDAAIHLDSILNNCTIVVSHKLFFVGRNIEPIESSYVLSNPESIQYIDGCKLYVKDTACEQPGILDPSYMSEGFTETCRKMEEVFSLEEYERFDVTISDSMARAFGVNESAQRNFTFILYNISYEG